MGQQNDPAFFRKMLPRSTTASAVTKHLLHHASTPLRTASFQQTFNRSFHASTANMVVKAYFDVTWTGPQATCNESGKVISMDKTDARMFHHPITPLSSDMCPFTSKADHWYHSTFRAHQLRALRRCRPQDCRELPRFVHGREGLRLPGQQVPSRHPGIYASGWRLYPR